MSGAHTDHLSCTRTLTLSDLTVRAGGLVRTLAIGAFIWNIPVLLGRAFPGRMLVRAETAYIFPIRTLNLYVPVVLALPAHLHPSFSVIRPVGEQIGTLYRPARNSVVGNDQARELHDE